MEDRLDRIETKLDAIHETVSQVRERTAALEVKAGFWGAFGGLISGILMYLGLKH